MQKEKKRKWSQEKAAEKLNLTADQLQKIESRVTKRISPEIARDMIEVYQAPELYNKFCNDECGLHSHTKKREIELKELRVITIELLSSLNRINDDRNTLIDIVEDGKITPDEYIEFASIEKNLKKIADNVSNLQLWVDKMKATHAIDFDEEA